MKRTSVLLSNHRLKVCQMCYLLPGNFGKLISQGTQSKLAKKKKSHEEEEFYFVSLGQKKKAHEACIQCIQCKHHVHNKTDFSEC